MDINLFRGIMTALLLVIFIGIWVWAWLPARKKRFDEAAQLPLEEDRGSASTSDRGSDPMVANGGVHSDRIRGHRAAPTEDRE